MKKMMLRIVIAPLLTSILLSSYLPLNSLLASPKETIQSDQTEITKAAKQWHEQLMQQPSFSHWKNASLTISSLGPGTHGWLVLLKQKNEVVGYMIIHAVEQGGYALSEYGTGDPASLQILAEHSDQLIYAGPFHSIIPVSEEKNDAIAYIEPFLLEDFPIQKSDVEAASKQHTQIGQGASKQPALFTGIDSVTYFSPYDVMPWLTTEPLNYSFEDDTSVEVMIELGSQLRYTTESWNNLVFSVYSITGYHEWNEFDLYLALQSENDQLTRYIPYDTLMDQGLFYDRAQYEL